MCLKWVFWKLSHATEFVKAVLAAKFSTTSIGVHRDIHYCFSPWMEKLHCLSSTPLLTSHFIIIAQISIKHPHSNHICHCWWIFSWQFRPNGLDLTSQSTEFRFTGANQHGKLHWIAIECRLWFGTSNARQTAIARQRKRESSWGLT